MDTSGFVWDRDDNEEFNNFRILDRMKNPLKRNSKKWDIILHLELIRLKLIIICLTKFIPHETIFSNTLAYIRFACSAHMATTHFRSG
jgi:hypothetical protein